MSAVSSSNLSLTYPKNTCPKSMNTVGDLSCSFSSNYRIKKNSIRTSCETHEFCLVLFEQQPFPVIVLGFYLLLFRFLLLYGMVRQAEMIPPQEE
jgi:hypothetical protein